MKAKNEFYVPCLRWKQGEYKAVSLLSSSAKDGILPLIEVPEKGFDFEMQKDCKSIDDHLKYLGRRIRSNWQQRPCFVDLRLIPESERMQTGDHPVTFVFNELQKKGCRPIPVTGLSRTQEHQEAIADSALKLHNGLCLRIGLEEAAGKKLKSRIGALLDNAFGIEDCDLILDLGAANFVPLEGFSKAIKSVISRLPYLNAWRSFSLIGTSFPQSMGEIQTSTSIIPRNEWLLYKMLVPSLTKDKIRVPAFGDYAINHPEVPQIDMRLVKPAATIRYAIDDGWLIIKGPNVRDNGFKQYRAHCREVTASQHFFGAAFSKGSEYILGCGAGQFSTGNLPTWRWVGTNHHVEKVVRDVANLFAA